MSSSFPKSAARARALCAARAAAVALALVSTPLLAGAPATAPASTHGPSASQGDCDHLLRQFDVAWSAHRDTPRAVSARRSRDAGEAECREGRFADGVHHLRRALHDIGLKPVKRVPPR